MPRIRLIDPIGCGYEISTMRTETLKAWFDEILPQVNAGLGDIDCPPAKIQVYPMWSRADLKDADWLTDSRMLGRLDDFPARTGDEGLAALDQLWRRLAKELDAIR